LVAFPTAEKNNCDDLKPENLKHFLAELVMYQQIWEQKLKMANGDPYALARLIKPDFSDIRKKQDFFWNDVPEEYITRFLNYYKNEVLLTCSLCNINCKTCKSY
jgi:hypothetical protein